MSQGVERARAWWWLIAVALGAFVTCGDGKGGFGDLDDDDDDGGSSQNACDEASEICCADGGCGEGGGAGGETSGESEEAACEGDVKCFAECLVDADSCDAETASSCYESCVEGGGVGGGGGG